MQTSLKTPLKILIFSILFALATSELTPYWTWKCEASKCIKTPATAEEKPISAKLCTLTCDTYAGIWPMPSKNFEITRELLTIDLEDGYTGSGVQSKELKQIVDRFFTIVSTYNDHGKNTAQVPDKTRINFTINDLNFGQIDFDIDESYRLEIIPNENDCVRIEVIAANLFGARNALETLSQIVQFDEIDQVYVVPKKLIIQDKPKYSYRGLMIDTARNFITLPIIKRIIEGMAVNKLNTLHWHIVDSQSFPFVSQSLPELSQIGAYSAKEVYTMQEVKELVEFAKIRGVRIIPEFDGPAHVGEGWQMTDDNLVVCFNAKPWWLYCKEPPCGQFDPTKEELYSKLQLLYKDVIESFNPIAFHFGGDEVSIPCWKSVESIAQFIETNLTKTPSQSPSKANKDADYINLWEYYQNKTYNIFMKELQQEIPAILWTSNLTDKENLHLLPNDKYIIQVWTNQTDETITNLLKNNYRVIFSFYDSLYLDCGFHSWTGDGYNWCSPYITWKQVYETNLDQLAHFDPDNRLIMGAEAALWTETADTTSAENRIWPRTAALAEKLWAETDRNWTGVELRLEGHRHRMVKLGIYADSLMPRWCYLNQDSCVGFQTLRIDHAVSKAGLNNGWVCLAGSLVLELLLLISLY